MSLTFCGNRLYYIGKQQGDNMKIGELYEWTDKTIKEYLGKTFVVIDLAFGGHYTVRFNHDGSECYMTSSELAYHKNLGSGYEKKTG